MVPTFRLGKFPVIRESASGRESWVLALGSLGVHRNDECFEDLIRF